uniref:Glycerol kinase 5 n=1 Tax=Phallusia mammillata TaxID=59560 RepID=A0A6F9DEA4_9ASCI|nr:putative glycerol kinase 5 [Phallusia mammillata]
MESCKEEKFVLSLDIGTTNIRCYLYNKSAEIVGKSSTPLETLYPEPQAAEIDPEVLWKNIQWVIHDCLKTSDIPASKVVSMGISTQRATFIVWDTETGKPIHNFLVWQDTRGDSISKSWNDSYLMKAIRVGSRSLHVVTQKDKFLAAAVLRFRTQHVSTRLLWLMQKYPQIKTLGKEGKVRFGNIDTWVVWKLTNGKVFASEYSCASSTGLYDPYILDWSGFFFNLLGIPRAMFPPILDTDADFGTCHADFFGSEIPIRCIIGDQQGAMFGQCCFKSGDVKLTLGTGAFLDLNVGKHPHTSVAGFYPIIGWKVNGKITHLAEGSANTAGTAVEWLRGMGMINKPDDCEKAITDCESSCGTYFVPAFTGIQAPINDYLACGSIMGLTQDTLPCHVIRAVLESLAFRNKQLFDAMNSETSLAINKIVCDGGVSVNSFVMQLTSDLIDKQIQQPSHSEMSALGAAFVAGLAVKFWQSQDQLCELLHVTKTYSPNKEVRVKYEPIMNKWCKAITRSLNWYK